MRVDLHIHTRASDGAWTPEAVVEGAAAGGLDVIAIADHDTVESVAPAARAAEDLDLRVVPGIEVSSTWEGREIHVLGYFVDPEAPALHDHALWATEQRASRMKEMIRRLVDSGVEVTFDDVLEAAGTEAHALARPHLARALIARGHARSIGGAFGAYLGDHCPAFVPTELQLPTEAVQLIGEAGGVAVWAHPPADLVETLLVGLIDAGLGGIEVYRPTHKREDVKRLEKACAKANLLRSGGSDWHTPEGGTVLGDFFVEGSKIAGLLEVGGL